MYSRGIVLIKICLLIVFINIVRLNFNQYRISLFYNGDFSLFETQKCINPPSIYDSLFQWSYRIEEIDFMPFGAFCEKQFYLIHIRDTTETYAYTIISFCDDNITTCQDSLRIGHYYRLSLTPLEKEGGENEILMNCDRSVKFIHEGIYVYISPPAKIYRLVSASEIKENFYQASTE
jgi:hypothetical protein